MYLKQKSKLSSDDRLAQKLTESFCFAVERKRKDNLSKKHSCVFPDWQHMFLDTSGRRKDRELCLCRCSTWETDAAKQTETLQREPGLPDGTHIFEQKTQIWVNFGGFCYERC
jgi:hypothetical protein